VYNLNRVGDQGSGGTQGLGAAVSDGVIFQFNEVYNVYAPQSPPIDGAGIDFETKAVNCYAQYNYIHDCEGAGYLTGSQTGVTNNNIVRFNVFARNAILNQAEFYNFGSADGASAVSTTAYCNTFYASHGNVYDNTFGNLKGTDAIVNSILISAAGAFCINGTISTSELFGNLYYAIGGGGFQVRPNGTTYTSLAAMHAASYEVFSATNYGVNADPLLSSPTSGTSVGFLPGAEVTTMTYFDPAFTSPAKDTGVDISGIVTLVHDFHNVSCSGHGANIGAIIPQDTTGTGVIRLPIRF
jgi:hypothetical protein